MNRKGLLLAALLATTAVFGASASARKPRPVEPRPVEPEPAHQGPPNVVLIFADNVGWGEIGAYGSVRG